jgi:AraC-like DNA-binding protein
VCISRTLFHLKFQERQGQTFHQYLTAQRLAKASALLQESDVPVHIIAEMVGLGYGQLRRLYFQHYGCTPGEFRKRGTG